MNLEAIRQRLAVDPGKASWRSLEELTQTAEFRDLLEREFPDQATEWLDPVTRRQFLILMGASLALAGVTGCSIRPAPREKIMPYVRQPEEIVPGKPLFFATAMPLQGFATGLLVESHEGRPTKVEGNPLHPASLGATDVFAQASILTLYDPDRSRTVSYRGRPRSWIEALAALRSALQKQRTKHGAGLRLLTEIVASPTLATQIQGLLKDFPEAKWYQYEPISQHYAFLGARQAFGKGNEVAPRYDFTKAAVVLALDADFLGCGPGHLRYVHDFMSRRRVRTNDKPLAQATMNRLYVVESMPTSTGSVADHRLPLRSQDVETFARAVAVELRRQLGQGAQAPVADAAGVLQKLGEAPALPDKAAGWLGPLVRDLLAHAGSCLVVAGDYQPPAVHALAHALNHALGNFDKTVQFLPALQTRPADPMDELRRLVDEMNQGQVEMLVCFDANPVFTAPVDLGFGDALARVPLRIHLGLYQDETAVQCDWHIPQAHYLESWGDARAFDGTATLLQPLIAPLYGGRSAHEVLATFTEYPERTGYDVVREQWRGYHKQHGTGEFEAFWQKALQDGVVPDLAGDFKPKAVTLRKDWAMPPEGTPGRPSGQGLEIVFRPDPTIHDGRFANNGWLQELPKPVTKLTWDNAAFMSPKTAADLGVRIEFGSTGGEHGRAYADTIELSYGGRTLAIPAWILPGHADGSITVHFGYGREHAGHVGTGTGFNVYRLRTAAAPWCDSDLQASKLGGQHVLACTEMHHLVKQEAVAERQPVHAATLEEYKKDPNFAHFARAGEKEVKEIRKLIPGSPPEQEAAEDKKPTDRRLVPLTLYPEVPYHGYRWGMAIDLTACVGCNACVVACQAENNIPVVGKMEVTRGREMHWLRIDRYYVGAVEEPRTHFQPVPCMQCEKAPCELVCPVQATAHSHDGLNDMVYNRCVGTRYCSNNCPYKVRRFNFLQYADYATESLKLLHNPNVTVRSRGVMEKCTYCVQRIRAAEIEAEKRIVAARDRRRAEGGDPEDPEIERRLRVQDGEVLTACQAACPAGAIVFGDINDPKSVVQHWKSEPLNYALLAELNTQPRTTYLAALRNPNPELSTA